MANPQAFGIKVNFKLTQADGVAYWCLIADKNLTQVKLFETLGKLEIIKIKPPYLSGHEFIVEYIEE